ncbi:MAG: DUF368 domain-containing protein [Nitriliruptorales bacterium]|nr:DUF368 domain-containing protein [Nitriliruptorales bacterium]
MKTTSLSDQQTERTTSTVLVGAIGFAMGSADLVPGVSGGTVALVAGIYERLVASIRMGAGALASLLRLDVAGALAGLRRVEWRFLVPLLGGILVAIFSLAGLLHTALDEHPELLAAGFFGLVLASTVVAVEELRQPTATHLGAGLATAIAVFLLLGLHGGSVDDLSVPVAFAGGALAVCAMILPGVSGSFLLLLVGLYDGVISAVDDRDLVIVGAVALGAAVGLGLFSTALHWVLRRHHDMVLALMLGLMVGSLRVLWPWPAGEEGVGDTALGAPTGDWWWAIAVAAAAYGLVVVLARAARRRTVAPAAAPTG